MGESGHLQSNAVQRKLPTPRSVEVHRLNYSRLATPLDHLPSLRLSPQPLSYSYTPQLHPSQYTP